MIVVVVHGHTTYFQGQTRLLVEDRCMVYKIPNLFGCTCIYIALLLHCVCIVCALCMHCMCVNALCAHCYYIVIMKDLLLKLVARQWLCTDVLLSRKVLVSQLQQFVNFVVACTWSRT